MVRVHSCCFAILNLLLLCRSRYCRRCRCLSLTTSLCRGDWGKHFPVAQLDKKRVLSQAQPLNSQYPEAYVVKEPKPYLWTLYQYIVFDIILKLAFIYSWNDFIWHQDRLKARGIYTNPTHDLASTSRMRKAISPGQVAAMDSFFALSLLGLISMTAVGQSRVSKALYRRGECKTLL